MQYVNMYACMYACMYVHSLASAATCFTGQPEQASQVLQWSFADVPAPSKQESGRGNVNNLRSYVCRGGRWLEGTPPSSCKHLARCCSSRSVPIGFRRVQEVYDAIWH